MVLMSLGLLNASPLNLRATRTTVGGEVGWLAPNGVNFRLGWLASTARLLAAIRFFVALAQHAAQLQRTMGVG